MAKEKQPDNYDSLRHAFCRALWEEKDKRIASLEAQVQAQKHAHLEVAQRDKKIHELEAQLAEAKAQIEDLKEYCETPHRPTTGRKTYATTEDFAKNKPLHRPTAGKKTKKRGE